jgi:hypothetical protein
MRPHLLVTALFLFASPASFAECLTEHLEKAIELNLERKPLYAELTQYESLMISNRLIFIEAYSLSFSKWLYWQTQDLRDAGIPILCSEFTPMDQTPKFKTEYKSGRPKLSNFKSLSYKKIRKQLLPFIQSMSFSELESRTIDIINSNELRELRFNCLARHVLESIAKSSQLSSQHLDKASSAKQKREITKSIQRLIYSQMGLLKLLIPLDNKAAPLQAQGVPILCQDVPPIQL